MGHFRNTTGSCTTPPEHLACCALFLTSHPNAEQWQTCAQVPTHILSNDVNAPPLSSEKTWTWSVQKQYFEEDRWILTRTCKFIPHPFGALCHYFSTCKCKECRGLHFFTQKKEQATQIWKCCAFTVHKKQWPHTSNAFSLFIFCTQQRFVEHLPWVYTS